MTRQELWKHILFRIFGIIFGLIFGIIFGIPPNIISNIIPNTEYSEYSDGKKKKTNPNIRNTFPNTGLIHNSTNVADQDWFTNLSGRKGNESVSYANRNTWIFHHTK